MRLATGHMTAIFDDDYSKEGPALGAARALGVTTERLAGLGIGWVGDELSELSLARV